MEELSQKDQIFVIFIPSDTAPTSVGPKSGFAALQGLEGSGLVEPWDLGNAPAFFWRAALIESTGKEHFLLLCSPRGVFCAQTFQGQRWCSPEEQQHTLTWDWWDSTTLKVFANLKSGIPRLFKPLQQLRVCPSIHPIPSLEGVEWEKDTFG